MKDDVFIKENFCFVSERDRTEDCSLEKYSESFIIGRDTIEKADLGDTRERQRDTDLEEAST